MALYLRCPSCGKEAQYGGYPAEPILSTVLCLSCRFFGPGAGFEHRHDAGEKCGKEFRP